MTFLRGFSTLGLCIGNVTVIDRRYIILIRNIQFYIIYILNGNFNMFLRIILLICHVLKS